MKEQFDENWLDDLAELLEAQSPPPPPEIEEPVCECGSHAVGSAYHSDWCPLYLFTYKQ